MSRTLRKRQRIATFSDDIEFDLEEILNDHEDAGIAYRAERDAKKAREEEQLYIEAFSGYQIALTDLPALCIERIMAMLDSPLDLYNMTFSSKLLMNIVTPEMVIRSAVFSNTKRKDVGFRKNMASIMRHVSNRSIYLPSPHRMLRVLNAKCCERGENCFGQNLTTGRSKRLTGSYQPTCGMALCDDCIKFCTTKIVHNHFANRVDTNNDDDKPNHIAFADWRALINPIVDDKGVWHGPLVGPIVLQQIQNSYNNERDEEKKTLKAFVEKALTEKSDLCPSHYEEKAATYSVWYDSAEKDVVNYQEKKTKEIMQKHDESRQERNSKRLLKLRALKAQLDEGLADCQMKDLVLRCTWQEEGHSSLRFGCNVVQQTLSSLLTAPSYVNKRNVRAVCESIKRKFNILHEKDFFSHAAIANSSNRFRKAMYDYCVNDLTPEKLLESQRADAIFFTLVEENKPTRALVRALNGVEKALENIFALSVARNSVTSEEDPNAEARTARYRKLATVVWNKKKGGFRTGDYPYIMDMQNLKECYTACIEEFRIMKKNAKDYLASSETRAFLRRDAEGGGVLSRRETVNLVFAPKTFTEWIDGARRIPYDEIRNRRFENLRQVHERYFRNPGRYHLRREDALA